MPFNPGLKQGEILTNEEICSVFKCSSQGGMRRSHQTGTLIIVSDHSTIFYDDKWDGDILRYTGMGQTGDQKLEGNQNITLYESDKNGVDVHLLEVYEKRKYTY
jgi:5-methylcytosine-specific restriction protein A